MKLKANTYLGYGNFLQTILEFLLLSFIIYTIFNFNVMEKSFAKG
ncbi:hypothetical protein ACEW7V_00345 [Areca yellow leaf disease phytoplasma]